MSDIDDLTLRRVALAKFLYSQALSQVYLRKTPTSKILALIGFDLAIESFLKVIWNTFNSTQQYPRRFPELFDKCNDLLKGTKYKPLPNRTGIIRLHKNRNDAQHEAKIPSDETVQEGYIYTRDFLTDVMRNLWGLGFDQISLSSWIEDKNTRNICSIIQHKIEQNDFEAGLALMAIIFEYAKLRWDDVLDLDVLDFGLAEMVGAISQLDSGTDTLLWNILDRLGFLTAENIMNVYRENIIFRTINPIDYGRFKKISPHVSIAMDGTPLIDRKSVDINKDDAIWVADFVVSTLLNWQSLGVQIFLSHDQLKRIKSTLPQYFS